MKLLTLLCFVMAFLPGCGTGGIVVHRPDGTVVEVTQPPKAVSPATLAWGRTEGDGGDGVAGRSESLTVGTGEMAAPPSPAQTAMGSLVWLGAALLVVGALIAFVPYLRFIPQDFGFVMMALGGGMIALPVILERYLTWILLGGLGYLLVRSGMLAKGLDWFKRETSPEKQMELKMAGHHDAAGSLAYLNTAGDRLKAKVVATESGSPSGT